MWLERFHVRVLSGWNVVRKSSCKISSVGPILIKIRTGLHADLKLVSRFGFTLSHLPMPGVNIRLSPVFHGMGPLELIAIFRL
jgi:hypothetical protein